MGISIHYRGKLVDANKIEALSQDLAVLSSKMNWSLEGEWAPFGFALDLHPKCETLFICFDEQGYLSHPLTALLSEEEKLGLENMGSFVKTHYAGSETHIWIIGLLKYLNKHYIPDLQVVDEADYWETGDIETLKDTMGVDEATMEKISQLLENSKVGKADNYSPEQIADFFEELIEKTKRSSP